MADADSQHTTKTIEILVSFVVPDVRAFTFHQRQRLLVISCDCGKKKLFMFANSFGLCSFRFSATHFRSFGLPMPRSLQIFSIRTSLIFVMSWNGRSSI